MALDDDIRILSRVGLFDDFTQEQLRLMAFGAESISLPAGRNLYWEGAAADCAFVVASGEVALFREHGGNRQNISLMASGSILGEFALIAETRRLTSAAAETDAKLIRLNRTLFRRILEEYPDTAEALRQRISDDLHTLIDKLDRVAKRLSD